jgi:putative ABC transport system substrate-binding protein
MLPGVHAMSRRRGTDPMRRRRLVTFLGGAALWPLTARGQETGRTYCLGLFIPVRRESPGVAAFLDELRRAGFVEGRNLVVVPGRFELRDEQFDEAAAAIVQAAPDAIVSGPDLWTRALQRATRTIPLIGMTEDMVASGLVDSFAKPGGNTTGISLLSPELDGKRQDILIEAVPDARRIAALADGRVTPDRHLKALAAAARARGVELSVMALSRPEEIAPAIASAAAAGAQALNVLATPLFFVHSATVIERAAALRLPAIDQWPDTADQGGLIGYGPRFTDIYRQRARMVAKILRGARPADVPVEQPTRFELVINLRTARAIGHDIPPALALRADKVIE